MHLTFWQGDNKSDGMLHTVRVPDESTRLFRAFMGGHGSGRSSSCSST
jgi:hypothetical protein